MSYSTVECLWQELITEDQEEYRTQPGWIGMAQKSYRNRSGKVSGCRGCWLYLRLFRNERTGWAEAREQARLRLRLRRHWGHAALRQSRRLRAKISEISLASKVSTELSFLHLCNWQKRRRNFYLPAVPPQNTEKENQIMWVKAG